MSRSVCSKARLVLAEVLLAVCTGREHWRTRLHLSNFTVRHKATRFLVPIYLSVVHETHFLRIPVSLIQERGQVGKRCILPSRFWEHWL